jgi:hypothetical protein
MDEAFPFKTARWFDRLAAGYPKLKQASKLNKNRVAHHRVALFSFP